MAAKIWAIFICVMLTALPGPVLAGDRALARVIGYSDNLRYFAFEEFGIQDVSGRAYSTFYVVDLKDNRWVVGTPVGVIAESDSESLTEVRARASKEVAPRLADLKMDVPAELMAANGAGAPDADPYSLSFGLPGLTYPDAVRGNFTVKLAVFPAESGSPCIESFAKKAVGFALTVSDSGTERDVYRDSVLPRSRACPVDYRLSAIYLPFRATDISRSVALISVFVNGTGGTNRRFIIAPLAFPKYNY